MDLIRNSRVVHVNLTINVSGNGKNVPGKVNNAVQLDGPGSQYIDVPGQWRTCFGNLALCPHGTTGSMWANFKRFDENAYYLSRGGLTMFYSGGKLRVSADVGGQRWDVSADGLKTDAWYFIEYSRDPIKGLEVDNASYIDDLNFNNMFFTDFKSFF